MQDPALKIEILYFAGCPNHPPSVCLAHEVLAELGLEAEVREVAIETIATAKRHRFLGSPSLRVNGVDIEIEARSRRDFGLSCRMYSDGGVPARALLVEALREALAPRHDL
ncbi:MAG: hypothetical protein VCB25_02140 [Myxococcota bacterium]